MAAHITQENRRWWVLIAMTGSLSMILLDTTVVGVALPTIQRDLDMSQTELQWVVNAYLLSLSALVAVGGRLADMFDRVKVFVAGVVVFVACSALSGVAQSDHWLIAARAAQGIGAALMIPPSMTLVINAFSLRERGRAMGIYAGVSMIFLSLGPLIGGLFTETLSWRWVFYVNLPVGILTIAMTLIARPDGTIERRQKHDLLGMATLVPGLTALVLALMQSTQWGWGAVQTVACLAAGGALLVAFVVVELKLTDHPLVELRLFKGRNFTGDNVVGFFVQFALMGMTIFGAIYVQDLLGYTPIQAGLSQLPLTIPIFFVAPIAGRLYDAIGNRMLVTGGSALIAAGLIWDAAVLHEFDYWWLIPGYIATGIGVGLVMSPTNTDAMNAAVPRFRGQASGVIQTMRQVGGSVGLAIVGTVVANVQRERIDSFLATIGLPSSQAKEVEATIGKAAEKPGGIGDQFATGQMHEILEGAKDSLADGISAGFYVAGGVMVVSTIVAFALLRKVEYHEADPNEYPPPAHPDPTYFTRSRTGLG